MLIALIVIVAWVAAMLLCLTALLVLGRLTEKATGSGQPPRPSLR